MNEVERGGCIWVAWHPACCQSTHVEELQGSNEAYILYSLCEVHCKDYMNMVIVNVNGCSLTGRCINEIFFMS